jgi:hypothetical protein
MPQAGLLRRRVDPIEEVLREFIATFHSPLPAHIADAMSVIFNLDDDNFDILDDALLQHTRTTVVDLDPLNEEV